MQSEIKQWGNSAAVRLSRNILAQAGLDIASQIEIEVKEGRIMIQAATRPVPVVQLPYSEAELLQGLTPQTAHADELADLSASEFDY
jgi:antitoxin MazE